MKQLLTGALSILGVLYVATLNYTNPALGNPLTAVLIVSWLIILISDWKAGRL